jgi:hypothetical protein
MNPILTQSPRGAEKERRGHGRLDRERHSTVIAAKPHESLVGLARRCRPKPQARMRRLQCQERKRNSRLHLGSLKNRTLASRWRTPHSTSLPHASKQAKEHPVRAFSSISALPMRTTHFQLFLQPSRPVAAFATAPKSDFIGMTPLKKFAPVLAPQSLEDGGITFKIPN